MTKKLEKIVDDVVFPDFEAISWLAKAGTVKVGGDVKVVSDEAFHSRFLYYFICLM